MNMSKATLCLFNQFNKLPNVFTFTEYVFRFCLLTHFKKFRDYEVHK